MLRGYGYLSNLGILPGFSWGIFVPIVLILVGLAIILGGTGRAVEFQQVTDSLALDGATTARITFKHGAGRLTVGPGTAVGSNGMCVSTRNLGLP